MLLIITIIAGEEIECTKMLNIVNFDGKPSPKLAPTTQ